MTSSFNSLLVNRIEVLAQCQHVRQVWDISSHAGCIILAVNFVLPTSLRSHNSTAPDSDIIVIMIHRWADLLHRQPIAEDSHGPRPGPRNSFILTIEETNNRDWPLALEFENWLEALPQEKYWLSPWWILLLLCCSKSGTKLVVLAWCLMSSSSFVWIKASEQQQMFVESVMEYLEQICQL